jgi:hypothetical protein
VDTIAPRAELSNRDKTLFRLVDANIIGVATCDAEGRIRLILFAMLPTGGHFSPPGRARAEPPERKSTKPGRIQATGRCAVFEKEYRRTALAPHPDGLGRDDEASESVFPCSLT